MNVFEEIKGILVEILDVEEDEVTEESYLIRELGAESIDLLELAAALNRKFGVEINEEDIFLKETDRLTETCGVQPFPFLTARRMSEIAADLAGGSFLKVRDLASYVTWQLNKMDQ